MSEFVSGSQDTGTQPFDTEFEFELPKGYVDEFGNVHRKGRMRLANAMDEISPLSDGRVRENKAYLAVLVLSRVITKLGDLDSITPTTVERLFAADLSYLQDFYHKINGDGDVMIPAKCPSCGQSFRVEYKCLGK
jgi:hypothetical protein